MGHLEGPISILLPSLVVDGDTGIIKESNKQFRDLTGFSRIELKGAALDLLIPERSQEAHDKDRLEYMKDPEPRPMGPDREVYMTKKDGTEIRVWIGLAPINGDVVACVLYPGDNQPGPLNPPSH